MTKPLTAKLAALTAVAVAAGGLVLMPASAQAATAAGAVHRSYLNVDRYCADVQSELASIKPGAVTINVVQYTNTPGTATDNPTGYKAFRSAKALADASTRTITVRQLVVTDADGSQTQVMCKTKSQDGLLPVFGAGLFRGGAKECSDVSKTLLRRAFTTLPKGKLWAGFRTLHRTVVDPTVYDEFGGNFWTVVGFPTLETDAANVLHVRSNGLYTPEDPNTPLSNAFIDYLNAQLSTFGLPPLPYGTTNGDLIAAGFVAPETLGTSYCTTATVSALQKALAG